MGHNNTVILPRKLTADTIHVQPQTPLNLPPPVPPPRGPRDCANGGRDFYGASDAADHAVCHRRHPASQAMERAQLGLLGRFVDLYRTRTCFVLAQLPDRLDRAARRLRPSVSVLSPPEPPLARLLRP